MLINKGVNIFLLCCTLFRKFGSVCPQGIERKWDYLLEKLYFCTLLQYKLHFQTIKTEKN